MGIMVHTISTKSAVIALIVISIFVLTFSKLLDKFSDYLATKWASQTSRQPIIYTIILTVIFYFFALAVIAAVLHFIR